MGKFNKVWITAIAAVMVAVVSLWWWQASIDSKSTVASGGTLNQTSEKGDNKKDCLTKAHQNNLDCIVATNTQFSSNMKKCENKLNEQLKLKRLGKPILSNPEANYDACEYSAKAAFNSAESSCTAVSKAQNNQCIR